MGSPATGRTTNRLAGANDLFLTKPRKDPTHPMGDVSGSQAGLRRGIFWAQSRRGAMCFTVQVPPETVEAPPGSEIPGEGAVVTDKKAQLGTLTAHMCLASGFSLSASSGRR